MKPEEIQNRIAEIETAMLLPDFWNDPAAAQGMIKELQELKDAAEDTEHHLEVLGTFVRLGVVVWSGFI